MTVSKTLLRSGTLIGAAALLSACNGEPLDFDLRGHTGAFSTSAAARNATENRPAPDDRGILSYPNYQVAIARRGDTLEDVAARVDLPVEELASYNGIPGDAGLRDGEVIALPRRVAEPSPETGAIGTGPIQPPAVDVTTLAGSAIDNADATPARPNTPPKPAAPVVQTGEEPIRHQVERGETAFTISRLYQVPVKSLAQWNGLGPDFAIREGQFLLIPVTRAKDEPTLEPETPAPGTGSPTPTPPSAVKPLPDDPTAKPLTKEEKSKPAADVGKTTEVSKPKAAKLAFPIQGNIIREYAKGRNEGIDIIGPAGAPVKAAADGTVAAITKSADGIPIIVVRHPDNLLTVYANVANVNVAKGDAVTRGQGLAQLRGGDDSYVHFEVRQGFDSVDPIPFLR